MARNLDLEVEAAEGLGAAVVLVVVVLAVEPNLGRLAANLITND